MSGFTIVLIHGFAFDTRLWDSVSIAFQGHRVVRLSLPGFLSPLPSEGYTIESMAEKLWLQLDGEGVDEVVLLGHSMGGYTAIEMVGQQPHRVKALGLIHSHVYADTAEKKESRHNAIQEIEKKGTAGFIDRMMTAVFADPELNSPIRNQLKNRAGEYDDGAWVAGNRAMIERKDHAHTLKAFQNPFLLVLGAKDKTIPLELGMQQATLPDQCTLHVYEEAGHLAFYECTPAFLRDLTLFITKL